MPVPAFLQTYLASYDLKSLDIKEDKDLIITEVLNKGDGEALLWLTQNYTRRDLKEVLSHPTRGMWLDTTLSYWLKIFNIKMPKKTYDEAVINLNPK